MKIIIEKIKLDDVLNDNLNSPNKKKYNVNNLYEKQPKDYHQILSKCLTKNWIDLFHKDNCNKIELDGSDLYWMKEAIKSGCITGRFPKMFLDDYYKSCEKYNEQFNKIKKLNDNNGFFLRTENVSFKYTTNGLIPYNKLEDIFEAIVLSTSDHKCIENYDKENAIYFMKWINIDRDKEFRVFVFKNKITAVSVQHLYEINDWILSLTNDKIEKLINDLNNYFEENIKDKMKWLESYVMDIALLDNSEFYFIEPNPFGKEYSSGSALYHWENDYDILYGINGSDKIHFRYLVK